MAHYVTTISTRRQTVVPADLGVKEGQQLIWMPLIEGESRILCVTVVEENPIEYLEGCRKGKKLVEELLKERAKDKKREYKKLGSPDQ